MNYDSRTQANRITLDELLNLCESLAPDPTGGPQVPSPPAGSTHLVPKDILDRLEVASSDLSFEDGLLESRAAAICDGHVILTGPPGSAKSTLANLLAEVVKGNEWTPATATAEWTVHDVVGGYMPGPAASLLFEPGLVLDAFDKDRWVVIDELNRADIDKAFGELCTILSGFAVELPQRDPNTGDRVTIAPVGGAGSYVVPVSWRMIGTMNTWDKTSLFRLSYAFMRRFAFIEVAVPP